MIQVSINLAPMRLMPGHNRFTHIFECFKVGRGVPVAKFVISNYRDPGFKELG